MTPEYQAIYEANIDDMEKGGQGIDPTYNCLSPGMPRVMLGYSPTEFVVTPDMTYILMTRDHDFHRHIYTDGRDFPDNMALEPRYSGLFHRQMARYRRRWPLRHTRSRDPRHEGTSRL